MWGKAEENLLKERDTQFGSFYCLQKLPANERYTLKKLNHAMINSGDFGVLQNLVKPF